jgi:hypothetical protein
MVNGNADFNLLEVVTLRDIQMNSEQEEGKSPLRRFGSPNGSRCCIKIDDETESLRGTFTGVGSLSGQMKVLGQNASILLKKG